MVVGVVHTEYPKQTLGIDPGTQVDESQNAPCASSIKAVDASAVWADSSSSISDRLFFLFWMAGGEIQGQVVMVIMRVTMVCITIFLERA